MKLPHQFKVWTMKCMELVFCLSPSCLLSREINPSTTCLVFATNFFFFLVSVFECNVFKQTTLFPKLRSQETPICLGNSFGFAITNTNFHLCAFLLNLNSFGCLFVHAKTITEMLNLLVVLSTGLYAHYEILPF